MFRIHATESPPDAKGNRTIWHRGAKNAELVSHADKDGKLSQQDFFLFDDILHWKKGVPARTGSARHADDAQDYSAQSASFDHDFDARLKRLERMSRALQDFSGTDKYILHLRAVISGELKGLADFGDEPVTRSREMIKKEELDRLLKEARAKKSAATSKTLVAAAGVAVAVLLGAVALLALAK